MKELLADKNRLKIDVRIVYEKLDKLTSSKLAQKLGIKTNDFLETLVASGLLELKDGKRYLTT